MPSPTPYELWKQAGEDGERYRELLIEHGHIVPLAPGEERQPLPCGWPGRRRNIINPDAGPIDIPDVDAYLAGSDPDDPPYVDLGGGMVVPLAELVEVHDDAPRSVCDDPLCGGDGGRCPTCGHDVRQPIAGDSRG